MILGDRIQREVLSVLLCITVVQALVFPSSAIPSPRAFFAMQASRTDNRRTFASSWRRISLDKSNNDIKDLLFHRDTWSDEQFRESLEMYDRFMSCEDSYVAPVIREALACLDQAYRLFGSDCVICSFNGGKDAVAVLHLVRAAHAHYFRCTEKVPTKPRTIYFDNIKEFPEILSLLEGNVEDYGLDMVAFETGIKYSEGLRLLVDNNIVSQVLDYVAPLAFVLGTRSSDPNAGTQGNFAPSSMGTMPPFMRVNPILSWTYGHVWHFIRLFKLPYCRLYDEGYTSLGTTEDTRPCPALAVPGSTEQGAVPKYWPAYMLRDWDQERAGRIKNDKGKKDSSRPQLVRASAGGSGTSQSTTYTDVRRDDNLDVESATKVSSNQATPAASTPVVSIDVGGRHTVGLLVIGDEILKGLTPDINSSVAAKALRKQNVQLDRVVVVSDDQEEIVSEIERLQSQVDVLITSGGVGPTHDDVTITSVAEALRDSLALHNEMAAFLLSKMNEGTDDTANAVLELSEAQLKMATLPTKAKLRYLSGETDWPILQCQNIFVLPGVPQFFEKKINDLAVHLSSQLERSVEYKVVLSVDEQSIVPLLNAAVEKHPDVTFGSYPFVGQPDVKTVVTLEGKVPRNTRFKSHEMAKERQPTKEQMDFNVRCALDHLIEMLPQGSVLRVDNTDGYLN